MNKSTQSSVPDLRLFDSLLAGEVGIGLAQLGADGKISWWSAGAEEITAIAANDAVGRSLEDLARPDAAVTIANSGSYDRVTFPAAGDPDGRWVEAMIYRAADDLGSTVLLRDVTAEHGRLDELTDSRETFEGILAIASDAVVCVNDAQEITFFNHGAETIFGYEAEEVIGNRLEMLVPELFRTGHAEAVIGFGRSSTSARRMGERGTITARRKGGEIISVEASISHVEGAEGHIYTAVLRDVTDRKRAEEALAANARELERSNAELEQFAYVASHDLQEPLRMVSSYTQLLARRYEEALDDDAREFIGYAVEGVSRMQALISDLLSFSRVSRRGWEPTDVSLEEVMVRVQRSLEAAIEEADGVITHEPLPTVRGDPMQLEQLFQNLIGNALKFRGSSPARVDIRVEAIEGGWQFEVRDNGIGIDPHFQERIFEIFQRLHSRTDYPGTGIGLSICRKIVERHGGRIWLESKLGEGTNFLFTLSRDVQ